MIKVLSSEMLQSIYLSGFKSGAASTVRTYTNGDSELAAELSDRIVTALMSDPVSMLEVENQVREIVTDQDSGSVWWTIPGDPHGGGDE